MMYAENDRRIPKTMNQISKTHRRARRLLAAILCLLLCIPFTSCTGKDTTTARSCNSLCSALVEEGTLVDCDTVCGYGDTQFSDYFTYLYDIPIENIIDGSICYVANGTSADEVSLLSPADAGKGSTITQALYARIDKRVQDYTGYNSQEVEKLNNAIVTPIGSYIALIISDHPDTVAQRLRQLIQESSN
jgi:hypothetical protein